MKINNLNSKIFSKLGQSGSIFGIGLIEAQKDSKKNYVISADMAIPAGLKRFISLYPEMFFNVGIAEQNMIGIAAGMANEGKSVIVDAQACFISMRSFEQIRQYMGYMKSNIIAIGISSGFALSFFGNTHYCIEDLSIMKSIPGLTIISPSDAGQAVKAILKSIQNKKPTYIRLTGTTNCPIVYKEDYLFQIGKSIKVQNGNDITIFATGSMVFYAIKASKILKDNNKLSVKIIDMHTIKPLDTEIIDKSSNSKLFVSIEEHSIIGGLGSSIADYIATKKSSPELLKLGIQDKFSKPGDYDFLLKQNRLKSKEIANDILKYLNQRI